MSKKRKKELTEVVEPVDDEMITLSKEDYETLMTLAEKQAEQTDTKTDDLDLEHIKHQYEEIGEVYPDTDNSRWELDSHPIVLDVLRTLRREIRMPDGTYRRPKGIKPMVNSVGQFDIASALSSYLSKDIALANIKEKQAHEFTVAICDSIIILIKKKHRFWELDKAYFKFIMRIIETKVYFHLTRPVAEGERKYRTQRMPMRETYAHDEVSPAELGYGSVGSGGFNFYKKDEEKTIKL